MYTFRVSYYRKITLFASLRTIAALYGLTKDNRCFLQRTYNNNTTNTLPIRTNQLLCIEDECAILHIIHINQFPQGFRTSGEGQIRDEKMIIDCSKYVQINLT